MAALAVALLPLLVGPGLVICTGVSLMCYDAEGTGLMSLWNRALTVHLASAVKRVLFLVPGGRQLFSCCAWSVDYALNKPNPIIQIFFLVLLLGGFAVFCLLGLPLVHGNPRLSSLHLYLPFAWISVVLYAFALASFKSPGVITKSNWRAVERQYAYDGFIFPRGKLCRTCGTPKLARSKHCRMTNQCVAQYDHHCPWLSNSVGALNFRYFLFFCASTMSFLVYGAYVFVRLFQHIIDRDRLWDVQFVHSSAPGVTVKADWMVLLQYLLVKHGYLLFVLILCVVMGLTLVAFTSYQLWMVYCGTTGNEAGKWDNVADFYDSAKWKREVDYRKTLEGAADGDVVIDPQSADEPSLEHRLVKQFPLTKPRNIYNHGFVSNLTNILWPPVHAFSAVEEEEPAAVEAATTVKREEEKKPAAVEATTTTTKRRSKKKQ